jgi:hypothetical protein
LLFHTVIIKWHFRRLRYFNAINVGCTALHEQSRDISRSQTNKEHVLSTPQRYQGYVCHECRGEKEKLPGNMSLKSVHLSW